MLKILKMISNCTNQTSWTWFVVWSDWSKHSVPAKHVVGNQICSTREAEMFKYMVSINMSAKIHPNAKVGRGINKFRKFNT